jgi:hypothetical protein
MADGVNETNECGQTGATETTGTSTGTGTDGRRGCVAPYVLVGLEDQGLYEYHVYCTLGTDESLEFVTPEGDVVATWPDEGRRPSGLLDARGDRVFHNRGDLTVRTAPKR